MRLPIISEEQAIGGGHAPQASLAQFAQVGAAGQGIAVAGGELGTGIARAGAVAAHAERVLKNEDMRLDMRETMTRLKEAFAQKEIEAKMRLGSDDPRVAITPDQYGPLVAKDLDGLMTEASASLKYPESQRAFRVEAGAYLSEQRIKSGFEGLKLWNAQIEARDGIVLQELANEAASSTRPEKQNKALGDGLDIIRRGVESGRYSGEQGAAKTKLFLSTVQRGRIQRDMRDVDLRPGVINTLLSGGYQYIDVDDQIKMGENLQKQSDKEYEDTRTAVGKWWTEQQAGQIRDWYQQAANKTLNLRQFEVDAKDWRLERTDYAAIRNEFLKPADETPSDPATLQRVQFDTHSQYPRLTEGQIHRLVGPGGLNRADAIKEIDRLRETREGLQNKAEAARGKAYADGKDDLQARLGVPTQWEKLDPIQKKAWSLAQEHYRRRVWPFNPDGTVKQAEDARAVVEELAPIFKGMMGADARVDKERLLGAAKAMGGYEKKEQVEADFKRGKLNRGQRDNLLGLFMEIEAKEKLEKQDTEDPNRQKQADKFGRPK